MSIEDNVVKFPDPLEACAQKIEAAIARRAKGDEEWIEGTLDLATELVTARDLHGKDDNKFGAWFKKRFDSNVIPPPTPHERAILIREGRNPAQMRLILEKAESRSLRMIFPSEEGSHRSVKTPSVGGDKTHAVHAALQANERAGVKATQKQMAEALGVSTSTVGEATRDMKSAQAANIFTYTKAQEQQVEARIKVSDRVREDEFSERVRTAAQKLYDENFPTLQKEQNEAFQEKMYYQKLIDRHEHIFTKTEYFDILFCTMNKEVEESKKHRASQALIAKKFQLTGEK